MEKEFILDERFVPFNKEDLKNISMFRDKVLDKISKIVGETIAKENLDWILQSSLSKDDIIFIKELNKVLESLYYNKFKPNKMLLWYYIIMVGYENKPLNLPYRFKEIIAIEMHKKFLNEKLSGQKLKNAVNTLRIDTRIKFESYIDSYFENINNKVVYNSIYLNDYEYWITLLKISFELFIKTETYKNYLDNVDLNNSNDIMDIEYTYKSCYDKEITDSIRIENFNYENFILSFYLYNYLYKPSVWGCNSDDKRLTDDKIKEINQIVINNFGKELDILSPEVSSFFTDRDNDKLFLKDIFLTSEDAWSAITSDILTHLINKGKV